MQWIRWVFYIDVYGTACSVVVLEYDVWGRDNY